MSEFMDDMPSIGALPAFDHEALAKTVLWPLVEVRCGYDWQEETFAGNELLIMYRGEIDGLTTEVELCAETEGIDEDDDSSFNETDLLSTVEVVIARHVVDERRDMIFQAMNQWRSRQTEESLVFPVDFYAEKQETLVAKIISSYAIDTDGDLFLQQLQGLHTADNVLVWDSKDLEDEEDAVDLLDGDATIEDILAVCDDESKNPILREHDMELLESGLIVARAPQIILNAFQVIKNNPTLSV